MVIAGACNRIAQQILMLVHSSKHCSKKHQKLLILIRFFTRLKKIYTRICSERPVIMLAAAVYPVKRFFMQKTNHIMAQSNLFHHLHNYLIMVGCNIRSTINRRKLMLSGSNFVMLCLCIHSQAPKLLIQLFHIRLDPRF